MRKKNLTPNQIKAITVLLETPSVEAAAKRVGVSRSTLFNWLNQEHFKDRLEQERKALFEEGLRILKGATAKAARKMMELLESRNPTVRRLTSKDIIHIALKVVELQELEERVKRLEEHLEREESPHR